MEQRHGLVIDLQVNNLAGTSQVIERSIAECD